MRESGRRKERNGRPISACSVQECHSIGFRYVSIPDTRELFSKRYPPPSRQPNVYSSRGVKLIKWISARYRGRGTNSPSLSIESLEASILQLHASSSSGSGRLIAAIERSYPGQCRESSSLGMIHGWVANRRSRAAILIGRGCYMPRLIIDPPPRYDRLTVHRLCAARWIRWRCFNNSTLLSFEFYTSSCMFAVCWTCSFTVYRFTVTSETELSTRRCGFLRSIFHFHLEMRNCFGFWKQISIILLLSLFCSKCKVFSKESWDC